jgi:hypothetical protein
VQKHAQLRHRRRREVVAQRRLHQQHAAHVRLLRHGALRLRHAVQVVGAQLRVEQLAQLGVRVGQQRAVLVLMNFPNEKACMT